MITKGPAVPTSVAVGVLSLVIGGVAGFYGRVAQETPSMTGGTGSMTSPATAGGGGRGGPGGGGGGGGMMGGGQQASASRDLTTLVRSLGTVEKVQNKGLTAEQKKALAPILTKIKSADKITDDDSKAYLASINSVLTSDQKDVLKSMGPPPRGGAGGRGGGGGMMGGGPMGASGGMRPPGMGGSGGMGASGGMAAMGGGGGAPDPTKPFANERNKQALDDLISAVQK